MTRGSSAAQLVEQHILVLFIRVRQQRQLGRPPVVLLAAAAAGQHLARLERGVQRDAGHAGDETDRLQSAQLVPGHQDGQQQRTHLLPGRPDGGVTRSESDGGTAASHGVSRTDGRRRHTE